ncbi:MAG: ATP synthase F1 subunit epsilon [Planctomycetota bacterium]|nr:ATP synthase F1 subunit epsilon [Planctomycetota bacterium]
MAASKNLQIVLVTPETTLLNEPVDSIRLPMFDGQLGIYPMRAPAVGRLGAGELRLVQGGTTRSYYIDGGFVQVKGPVVSVLTNRAVTAESLSTKAVEDELQAAKVRVAKTDDEFASKAAELAKARKRLALAKKGK